MLANDPRLMAKSEDYLNMLMESSAVKSWSRCQKRVLVSLNQDHDEPFRIFATRVRSKGEIFNFTTVSKYDCGKKIVTSYTEEAIKDVMLAGVGDEDIKREVLSTEEILFKSSFEIIFFIGSKEIDRQATENFQIVSLVFSFQR